MGRGAFIVFEGLDRSGKSTQAKRIAEALAHQLGNDSIALNPSSLAADPNTNDLVWRFPDRKTHIGVMIDAYLQSHGEKLDSHALHLLFSANRWERCADIHDALNAGKTVIVDRYVYSGTAYSCALGLDTEWCLSPDKGLPKPDILLFLSVSPEVAATRGDYGRERYENNSMQMAVRESFSKLLAHCAALGHNIHKIDADKDADSIHDEIFNVCMKSVQDAKATGSSSMQQLLW